MSISDKLRSEFLCRIRLVEKLVANVTSFVMKFIGEHAISIMHCSRTQRMYQNIGQSERQILARKAHKAHGEKNYESV